MRGGEWIRVTDRMSAMVEGLAASGMFERAKGGATFEPL
jgi:hypothetical protein